MNIKWIHAHLDYFILYRVLAKKGAVAMERRRCNVAYRI
jgi:hypothetical protein